MSLRRRPPHLTLEQLEERCVPAPVFVVRADHSLWESVPGGLRQLSPAGTVLSASASTDHAGQADVFAIAADTHLWENTPGGWSLLSSGSFQQVSAATNAAGNAVAFGVLGDGSLWEYSSLNANGWAMLSPAGTVLSVSAVTDGSGNDVVYAITAGRSLWQHSPANPGDGWLQLSTGPFQQISAGLAQAAPVAVVYGVMSDGSLWLNDPTVHRSQLSQDWVMYSPPGTILSASAGGPGEVFAIASNHTLWYVPMNGGWTQASSGSFASISGDNAGSGELYAVLADTSLWEFTTGWMELDLGGDLSVAAPSAA